MKTTTLTQIRQTLQSAIDPKRAQSATRFFKEGEEALVYGVGMNEVGKIGKAFYNQIRDCAKSEIFDLCEELWKSKYLEEAVVACIFSESLHKKYEPSDFQTFERWVAQYVNNWADCDTLCNHTVGTFIMTYPEYINELKRWTQSPNRWMRRAAAVTLIIPARKGLFLRDIFEIANLLLLDGDDLVQKGYGWMLKAASQSHPQEVFEYVMQNRGVMPRTALRYAIEKMPQERRTEAMKR
jgi:3-methyladenine DNA glycosylase AlkD